MRALSVIPSFPGGIEEEEESPFAPLLKVEG
jgi:hypothetical protein